MATTNLTHRCAVQPIGFHLFETTLGWMGIAWSERGLTRVWLFERTHDNILKRVQRHHPDLGASSPPAQIAPVVDDLKRYASGERVDFSSVPVDLAAVDAFRLAIYDAAQALQYGETTTYGELAKRAGHAGLTRETGAALGANPLPVIVPCHRILAAGNKIGGFSAPGGSATKERMLAMEGVRLGPPPPVQSALPF